VAKNVVIDWGARSRLLQSHLQTKLSTPSFWISPQQPPVALGTIDSGLINTWDTAPVTPIELKPSKQPLTVEGEIPPAPANVRLDVALTATIGSETRTTLAFHQLFLATSAPDTASGVTLNPILHSMEDWTLAPRPSGPFHAPGTSMTGRRVFGSLHPLLEVRPGYINVNTEFVDATELWWATRHDEWGWYLNPELGGRQENLRVLAWTGGGMPMIWFAVVADAMAQNPHAQSVPLKEKEEAGGAKTKKVSGPPPTPQTGADIVFFRPPPGDNTIDYTPDRKGFENKAHDGTTLHILARYLLSPLPATKFAVVASNSHIRGVSGLADQIQPRSRNPTVTKDPMQQASRLWDAFRPVGLEQALNATGAPHVLFLPLLTSEDKGSERVVQPDLKSTIASALNVLWNNGAVQYQASTSPDLSARQLWLAGHSVGNVIMWACLSKNAVDVDRVISCDASPSSNLNAGIKVVTETARKRKVINKKIEAFFITTPNLTRIFAIKTDPTDKKTLLSVVGRGLDDKIDLDLRKTGAVVTLLPDFSERDSFWTIYPASEMRKNNPYLRYLLAQWSDAEINLAIEAAVGADPAKRKHFAKFTPTLDNWLFLFFHELAVAGGHLVPATTQGGDPIVRTLFQDALGASKPRPPFP
jgi:hypothetical protein